MNIALLTDYAVTTFATGPAFSTQALKRYLEARGHTVTIVGPRPAAGQPQPVDGSLLFSSAPFRGHPGMNFGFPWGDNVFANLGRFDVIHSHANSLAMHWAPMMRKMHGIPCVATNTIYLPAWAQHALPDAIYRIGPVRRFWTGLSRAFEKKFARTYNQHDGLIVQCAALDRYWREVGTLEVPLHVIPRPIDAAMWDRPPGEDPLPSDLPRGKRLVLACRHAREKEVDKVIRAFASHILPAEPDASLTLIGDGQEHARLVELARSLGVLGRCHFPGERPQHQMRDYYAHTDIFVYASVTETYGQVVSEALWCGVPVVAIDDEMGVAFQCKHGEDSILVPRGEGDAARIGAAVVDLLRDPDRRRELGRRAAERARQRVPPDVVYAAYERAYTAAIEHLRAHPPPPYEGTIGQRWSLFWSHVWPWLWQHTTLIVLGAVRGGGGFPLSKEALDRLPQAASPAPAPRG